MANIETVKLPDGTVYNIKDAASGHAGEYLELTDLGTSYSAELKADISSGAFKIAKVGGCLTINNHVYVFAHPDYWLDTGDTVCNTHHMVVVPLASNLVSSKKMNSSATTSGGYLGSDFKTGANSNTALAAIKQIIETDFGASNILTHRDFFTNLVSNGHSAGGAWSDSYIDLMSELMVYGCYIFSPTNFNGSAPFNNTASKTQLELFAKRPDLLSGNNRWWLRDVTGDAAFAYMGDKGYTGHAQANNDYDIRPAFAIC